VDEKKSLNLTQKLAMICNT